MAKRPRGNKFTASATAFLPPPPGNAVIPRGPLDLYRLGIAQHTGSGPGPQEAQYKSGTTSASEFFIIWALRQIFRRYPNGGENLVWVYQKSVQGGRHLPGGSIVDFVIFGELWNIGLRIQTFYWHFEQGAEKFATDFQQKRRLENSLMVIDIYEQDYINDLTGQAAIRVVLEALAGRERTNPRAAGYIIGHV